MSVDYEVEYNNRARVPEYAEIFARWQHDAAAYRDRMKVEENAELGLAYGTSPRQKVDLFFPAATGHTPLALFVHGGYWRSLDASSFSHVSAGLNSRGVAVAVAGYDLCPDVTIGQIINQIRTACMVATDWKKLDPKAPIDLVPAGYSISGLFDLTPLIKTAMNVDLRLDDTEVARISPMYWPVTRGRVFDAVVGGQESSEFLRQSHIIADNWRQRGVETRYEEIAGANHFTAVDPLSDPNSAMTARCAELAARCA